MTKDILLFAIAFMGLATGWYVIYIKPQENMRSLVHNCMLEIGDQSIQGYAFCKRSLNPNK